MVSRWQKQTEQTNSISDIAEESRKQEDLLLPAVAGIHSCPVEEDCGQTVEKSIEDSISVIQDATPLSESPWSIYDRCRSVHREQQERQRKDYLAKNLTHKAKEGFIKLDKLDKGDFLFHQCESL